MKNMTYKENVMNINHVYASCASYLAPYELDLTGASHD